MQRVAPSNATVSPSGPRPRESVSCGVSPSAPPTATATTENAVLHTRTVLGQLILIFRSPFQLEEPFGVVYFAAVRVGPSTSERIEVAIQSACACPGHA